MYSVTVSTSSFGTSVNTGIEVAVGAGTGVGVGVTVGIHVGLVSAGIDTTVLSDSRILLSSMIELLLFSFSPLYLSVYSVTEERFFSVVVELSRAFQFCTGTCSYSSLYEDTVPEVFCSDSCPSFRASST
ncbi:hypothetical protein DW767_14620 [Blautia obeum]|uniref:Uncharacterized protein n=1 Tax=Blautia obeum TaxID=40520 RepID=A0A414I4U0_9FIRM|nr:hypothetical protein DW767_14620 [Blautia obeum]